MAFKPIEGLVNIGSYTTPQGMLYCWENDDRSTCGCAKDLSDFIQRLRELNIGPHQIDNIGTENLYSERFENGALERVLHGLGRPIIRVLKRYVSERENKEAELDHPYLIEMGDKSFKCGLKDVPTILSELGCKRNDVLFHQEIPEGYDLLNKTEKFHIQDHTSFDERESLN